MSPRHHRASVRLGERTLAADVALDDAGRLSGDVVEGGRARTVEAQVERASDGSVLLRRGSRLVRALVLRQGDVTLVSLDGSTYELREGEAARRATTAGHEAFAVSPMTGLVAQVAVAPGAAVAAGGALFVVEAMKMEYVVRATRAVTVEQVRRKAGEKVSLGEVVVTFAEPARGAS